MISLISNIKENLLLSYLCIDKNIVYAFSDKSTLYFFCSNTGEILKEVSFNGLARDNKVVALNSKYLVFSDKEKIYLYNIDLDVTCVIKYSDFQIGFISAISLNFKSDIYIGDENGYIYYYNTSSESFDKIICLEHEIFSISFSDNFLFATTFSYDSIKSNLFIYDLVNKVNISTIELDGKFIYESPLLFNDLLYITLSKHKTKDYKLMIYNINSNEKEYFSDTVIDFSEQLNLSTKFSDTKMLLTGKRRTLYVLDNLNKKVLFKFLLRQSDVLSIQYFSNRFILITFNDLIQIIDIKLYEKSFIASIKANKIFDSRIYIEKNRFLLLSDGEQIIEQKWKESFKKAVSFLKVGDNKSAMKEVDEFRYDSNKMNEITLYTKKAQSIVDFQKALVKNDEKKAIKLLEENKEMFIEIGLYKAFANKKWFPKFKLLRKKMLANNDLNIVSFQRQMGSMYFFNRDVNDDLFKNYNIYNQLENTITLKRWDIYIKLFNKNDFFKEVPIYLEKFDFANKSLNN